MNEARYRDAELRLWESLALAPSEQWLQLERSATSIRVQEVGSGPPVILVHGTRTAGASWAPLVAGLGEFRCVMVDRPGCGLSEPIKTRFDNVARLEAFADGFIADVLDSLELDRASVVATSFGGYIGFRSVAAHPERIDRVVEFGYSVGAPIEKIPFLMRLSDVTPLGRAMASIPPTRSAVRFLLRRIIGLGEAIDAGRVSDETIEWFLALLRDTNTMRNEIDAGPRLIDPIRGLNREILFSDSLLASIPVAIKFVWGTKDIFGGAEVARGLIAKLPDAELELMDGVGHAPWVDDPDHSARSVSDFLAPS